MFVIEPPQNTGIVTSSVAIVVPDIYTVGIFRAERKKKQETGYP